ncbi:unnamed protein product [Cuscuta campestris]|uniref:BED-type domain-containing protein n=1 Tax=Cuscuta campestris TaxID=132261 RepID=A0A484LI09_9ASTE|nr:unnamed protein product [Cuscuta campestris]
MFVSLAWEHCTKLKPNSSNDLVCNFCGRISNGGIRRFKQHLIRGHRNTVECPTVLEGLKTSLRDLVLKEAGSSIN